MKPFSLLLQTFVLCLLLTGPTSAHSKHRTPALASTVVLIIRHAEKPDSGPDLAPEGFQRAAAYPRYFRTYQLDGHRLHLSYIYASADTKGSDRPRLTVTPLGRAIDLPVDQRFKDKDVQDLARDLPAHAHGAVLVCWHHGEIPDLLRALGANPDALLPQGEWPGKTYNWVLELHYGPDGRLLAAATKRVTEHLMPWDNR